MNTPGLSWGAAAAERAATLPCDALLPTAQTRADRAISVDAPPDQVFTWLCQLRRAPYSYDLIDNLGRRSPRTLNPALAQLKPGQRFMTLFVLDSFDYGRHITLRGHGVAVTYAVAPQRAGARLHVRVLFVTGGIIGRALACADMVMMRKQLLTLTALAEREGAPAHVE